MSPFVVTPTETRPQREGRRWSRRAREEAVAFSADAESLYLQPYTSKYELPGQNASQRVLQENVVEATIFPGILLLADAGAARAAIVVALAVARGLRSPCGSWPSVLHYERTAR